MGQRANLVIVDGDAVRLYYDHWCANRLDVELLWGPAAARAFIEQLDPATDADWLDEVWCEGAAVLDADRRTLLFFGGEDVLYDVPLRRAHLALMTAMWPGWDIRWAQDGLSAIADHLGMATDRFLSPRPADPEEKFLVRTDFPEDNRTLLTATRDGATTALRVDGDFEALRLGPGGLAAVDATAGAATLDWPDDMPWGGVHLDHDRRALAFWWAHPTAAAAERARTAWPGWEVRWLGDRYEEHLALAGLDIRLPELPSADLQRQLIDTIRDRFHRAAANPARAVAERLGAELSPASDAARGSIGDRTEKLRILNELLRRLPFS